MDRRGKQELQRKCPMTLLSQGLFGGTSLYIAGGPALKGRKGQELLRQAGIALAVDCTSPEEVNPFSGVRFPPGTIVKKLKAGAAEGIREGVGVPGRCRRRELVATLRPT